MLLDMVALRLVLTEGVPVALLDALLLALEEARTDTLQGPLTLAEGEREGELDTDGERELLLDTVVVAEAEVEREPRGVWELEARGDTLVDPDA